MHHSRTRPVPNFTRLDPGRPEVAILMDAMLRARKVVATRPWSTSQEPTSEYWWADVLADPRARIRRQPRGFYGRDGRRTTQKSCYRLANEPSPVIEVACSKCEWKGAFSRAELLAMYGAECPLPTLLIIWRCLVAPKLTPTGIGAASTMSTQSMGANGSSRTPPLRGGDRAVTGW
jgi:hypothetical protein